MNKLNELGPFQYRTVQEHQYNVVYMDGPNGECWYDLVKEIDTSPALSAICTDLEGNIVWWCNLPIDGKVYPLNGHKVFLTDVPAQDYLTSPLVLSPDFTYGPRNVSQVLDVSKADLMLEIMALKAKVASL